MTICPHLRAATFAVSCLCFGLPAFAGDELDYAVTDPELKVVRLDSAPTESFLAIKVDTTGRLFVGGREALFVYEVDGKEGYQPRRQLLQFPDHTWVYDIEIRGDDLYILTVSALYVIPEGRVKREGLTVRRLIWGVPLGHVHQCFHGLTWGPEGDLYFAMGDPLWYYGDFNRPDHWGHWTFFSRKPGGERDRRQEADWARTPYNGVGAVFRCRPDGSRFQVVATGLRNSCGLAFDRDWNLFTNDNDHESIPADYVPGRLNHVTPHAYFSWPRGWMPSKTPDRMDLLDTMNDQLGRFVPVGQSYYDDPYLPEKYRHSLLVTRWCTRQITYYPLRRKGATFQCDEHVLLQGRDLARPVHVAVGRGGRIFASICYMAHNEGSPVYKSDLVMIMRADDPDAHPFEAYDAPTAPADKLFAELSNPSWSRRKEAHVELLRRGGDLLNQSVARVRRATHFESQMTNLIWLAAAARTEESATVLTDMGSFPDDNLRTQLVRAIAEFRTSPNSTQFLRQALTNRDALNRLSALQAYFQDGRGIRSESVSGKLGIDSESTEAPGIAEFAGGDDAYLRHTAAMLMARFASIDLLGNMLQSGEPPARLAAVLAAGFRLTLPPATGALADDLPLAPWRNPDEAYNIQYIDAQVDLRDYGRLGTYTVAEHWKAGKHTPEQETLFALLAARLGDEDEKVRLQASHFLYLLNDERTEPVIARVRSDIQKNRLAVAPVTGVSAAWAVGPFADGPRRFVTAHPPEKGPFDPAATYPNEAGPPRAWQQLKPVAGRLFDFREALGVGQNESCYAFARIESGVRQTIELLVGSDDGVKVWLNGKLLLRNDLVRGALPFQDVVPLDLQPGSNDLLLRVRNVSGESGLYLHYRSLQPVAFVLPEPLEGGTLAARLREPAANPAESRVDPQFLEVPWEEAAKQGDAARGKKLFSADGLGCAKCHAVSNDAAVAGGPSLADAAKRFTVAHLVESVLLPNKTISPVFKAAAVVTKEGKAHTGLVIGDTAEKVELILTDGSRASFAPAEIEERTLQDVSPMPAGLVRTVDELRDLLAFLLHAAN